MARGVAVAAVIAVSLLAVSGAGGAGTQTPKRGGTLVIGTATFLEPACLNALVDACRPTPATVNPVDLILDGAFDVKPGATYRAILVSRVDTVSRQPFTLRYHIRPEARWSDGTLVTAGDFEFTHQALLKHRPEVASLHLKVRSVRRLDAKTVRVVLREPFADWRELFPYVLPRHALAGQDLAQVWRDGIDNPKTGAPIGSGPFLIQRPERGKQLTLVRNPRYWGPHAAYLDRIVFRFYRPQDTADALRRGEIDMIQPGPLTLQAAAVELRREPTPGVQVLSVRASALEHFDIRIGEGGHPALKNPLVRQALAYGIDRVAIARAIGELSGARGAALEPVDSVVFLTNSAYYQPNWKGYRHRPAFARTLLERAGCRRGSDGIYSCARERLALRFATVTGVATRERTVELAQAQLRQVGVEVRPEFTPQADFFATVLQSGDFDLALFLWGQGASTSVSLDIFGCQRSLNFTGYCSRLVTRDLDQATRILNGRRRVQLLNNIDARLAKVVPAIPLYQGTGLFALKTSVRGVVPNGAGPFTWNAENWWLDR